MPNLPDVNLFELPSGLIPVQLQEISSHCGQQTALVLMMNFPGVRLHIPKKPSPTHKLAELLGMMAFSELCLNYGGVFMSIPRAAEAIRALRNQQILCDFAQGSRLADIALKYGMTQRQVSKICNSVAIDRQLDIFN